MDTTVLTSAPVSRGHALDSSPNPARRLATAAVAALSLVVAGVGCTGAVADANGSHRLPGHGAASRSFDVDGADHSNPFDTTDDPSDPAFVPTASKLKPFTRKGSVAQSHEALSTTTGTTFALTYYDVSERPANDPAEIDLYDCNGNWLTSASQSWSDDAWMQGTARFVDGNGSTVTINDGGGCWTVLPYSERWGLGVTNPATGNEFSLRVFRSIAVDPSVLTIGKWYYVKELDGATMPSPAAGMVHDGCVRAMDVGPAINGRHIDFFVGKYSAYQTLINGNSSMGGRESITLYDGAANCQLHITRGY